MSNRAEHHTVLVTAYAKAPQGTVMYEVYKHAGIILEIDRQSQMIVDAEFTFIADLTKDYFRRIMVGYDLSTGIEGLIEKIETNYFAPSTNSIIVALKSAYQRYREKINP